MTPKETDIVFHPRSPKTPSWLALSPSSSPSKSTPRQSQVSVRPPAHIPTALQEYFSQQSPSLSLSEKDSSTLCAQVYLHELDEGLLLLSQAEKKTEAALIGNFDQPMDPQTRLELMRHMLGELPYQDRPAQRVQHLHKVRYNQHGAVKTQLGRHPAVAITQVGLGYKSRNEDAFLVLPQEKLIALADGLGGHPGGHIASGLAVDFFEYAVLTGADLKNALSFANEALLVREKSDPRLGGSRPMGTTFAAIQLRHSLLKIVYVGDTKVMVLRNQKIIFQTQDHTEGQLLLQEGRADLSTAYELNHLLSRSLGLNSFDAQRHLSEIRLTLERGDRIFLATDGVTDNFYENRFELPELVPMISRGSLPQAAETVAENCLHKMRGSRSNQGRRAKRDNFTLALIEYRG